MAIGRADPSDGSCDDFGKPGGRGTTGRGSSGPTFTGNTGSTGGAGFGGVTTVGAGGGAGLGFGTGIATGGATDGGGARGGASGAVATAAAPAGAAGGAAGTERVGGRKPPRGGRTGPAPWPPVKILGVAVADSGRVGRWVAGVRRGRRRTGSSSSRGCGGASSPRCALNFSRTLSAVASSTALE